MLESMPQSYSASVPPVPLEQRPYTKRQQLLQELMGDSELLLKNRLEVRHLMTPSPVRIPPTMPLEEIIALMQERRLHHLLVCGRGGELVGVLSDRDLRMQRGTTAQQLMTYPPRTCTPDTPLGAAITFLINEHISCLPVVDNGRLCGVLTTTDLVLTLQCMLQLWLRLAQSVQHDPTWSNELEKIAASLDGDMTAEQLGRQIAAARHAVRQAVQGLVDALDLHADALTGMGSRRELEEIVDLLLGVKTRYGRPFSLVVVTIDHYQRIRENCGKAVVKPLVKAVAAFIEGEIKRGDFAARYRDDAFAVVLAETGLEQAREFCRRVQDSAHRDMQFDIKPHISVAAVEAQADEDVDALLRRAEGAV